MILQTQQLQGGYGASQVLFGVDLSIQSGQVVTVLGRNGMGKSTLLKTVLGLLPIRGGEVHFDGQKINGWTPDKIARAGIAIVPEGRHCFPNLTVKEHLTAFAAQRNPNSAYTWSPEKVFEFFPRLLERQHNMGNQLS
ncbi:ABC transporter ATP-binding protein, partial [uncultured Paenalcaligenes sp.]